MADEAVVRIVLEGGRGDRFAPLAADTTPPPSIPSNPPAPAGTSLPPTSEEYSRPPKYGPSYQEVYADIDEFEHRKEQERVQKTFDAHPRQKAQKAYEKAQEKDEVYQERLLIDQKFREDEEEKNLRKLNQEIAKAERERRKNEPFDPDAAADKEIERRQQKEAVATARARKEEDIYGSPEVEEARKAQIEAVKAERIAVLDLAYQKKAALEEDRKAERIAALDLAYQKKSALEEDHKAERIAALDFAAQKRAALEEARKIEADNQKAERIAALDLAYQKKAALEETRSAELTAVLDLAAQKRAALEEAKKAEEEDRKAERIAALDLASQKKAALEETKRAEEEDRKAERIAALDLAAQKRAALEEDKKAEKEAALDFAEFKAKTLREQKEAAALPATLAPEEQARDRRKREMESKEVDKEYKRLYGNPLEEGAKAAKKGAGGDVIGAAGDVAGMMGMEELAAAAGPVAIAAAVYVAAVKAATDATRGAVGAVGDFATALANPNADPSVPISQMGDAASKTGEKLVYLEPVIGLTAIVAGETAKSLSSLMQAIDKTAERYGEFSPQIAQAQAGAEIRQMVGDLRRSQEVGNALSKYLIAQSEIQQKFENIKVQALQVIVPTVTSILDTMNKILEYFQDESKPDVVDPTDVILNRNRANTPFGQALSNDEFKNLG